MSIARIAVIEDEKAIRQTIREELEEAGYDVVEAADGRQGLDVIVSARPDLVLCDITMPVLSGYQLLDMLRAGHKEFAEMPVVFLSALADREDVIFGKTVGADDYITKPIDFEMLLATVFARIRQVMRMQARSSAEMIRLRQTFAVPPTRATRPHAGASGKTVVVVSNDDSDINLLVQAVEEAGHAAITMRSGKSLVGFMEEMIPQLVLLSWETADLQAPFAVRMAGLADPSRRCPVVLVMPARMGQMPTPQQLFSDVLKLPAETAHVGALLQKWLPGRE
ncbi:MAG: response regulator [Rhodospirillales bacterium]|nr:response regulator [Rhodospirillales bacterium]